MPKHSSSVGKLRVPKTHSGASAGGTNRRTIDVTIDDDSDRWQDRLARIGTTQQMDDRTHSDTADRWLKDKRNR